MIYEEVGICYLNENYVMLRYIDGKKVELDGRVLKGIYNRKKWSLILSIIRITIIIIKL